METYVLFFYSEKSIRSVYKYAKKKPRINRGSV